MGSTEVVFEFGLRSMQFHKDVLQRVKNICLELCLWSTGVMEMTSEYHIRVCGAESRIR